MASQDAFVQHIVSRMRADIDFLVARNVMSPADARVVMSKFPQGGQAAPPAALPAPATTPQRGVQTPPVRGTSQAPQARALWAYNMDGQEADDLPFDAGETIEIIEETNGDWWRGKNARGQTGLFPSNHVEKISAPAAPPPPSYVPPPAPAPAPAPAATSGGRMVAPPPSGKFAYDPMATPPAPAQEEQQAAAVPKKNKFGKFGNTMAQSAAGGVGFGAGAAIGSGIVHAIF